MTQEELKNAIKYVSFSDTTQREGRQAEGAHLTMRNSLRHVELVEKLGIDMIELNHPASSAGLRSLITEVAGLNLNTKVATHVRCDLRDVQMAIDTGVKYINTYIPIRLGSIESINQSIERSLNDLEKITELTRKNEVELRVSVEHALSLPLDLLEKVYKQVSECEGVHRVGLAETTGCAFPDDLMVYVDRVYKTIPKDMKIQFHMHNDHGLVAANFLAILKYLVKNKRHAIFDISAGGYGERNGILSYGDVFSILYLLDKEALKKRYAIQYYADMVEFLEERIGVSISRRDPLNPWAFSHSAGPHLAGIISENSSYQRITPKDFGFDLRLNIGHCVTGYKGVQYYVAQNMGQDVEKEQAKKIASLIREYATNHGPLSEGELFKFLIAYIR